jgi:hypothetical protein
MRLAVRLMLVLGLVIAGWLGWRWLDAHPQHNPYAPLRLDQPVGWATAGKLTAMVEASGQCRAMLRDGGVRFSSSPAIGSGACRLDDRTRLDAGAVRLRPDQPHSTCAVAAGLILWQRRVVAPAAERHLGQRVTAFEHMGTTNCRSIAGSSRMSEHATGNAFDISAFRLASGRRITLLAGWNGKADERAFLREVRNGACTIFGTTLSPDFNAAHHDHFHFDMADREFGAVCQ